MILRPHRPGTCVDRSSARRSQPARAAAAAVRRPPRLHRGAARIASSVTATRESPMATLQHPTGAPAADQAPPPHRSRDGARAVEATAVAAYWQIGLGSATANGLHEKNEDAAVIARLARPDPASSTDAGSGSEGNGGQGGIAISAALSGAGLKNDDPPGRPLPSDPRAPLSSRALARAATVSVAGLDGGVAGAPAAVIAHLAAVLDGHGGRGTSKWASRRLPHLVAENLMRDPGFGRAGGACHACDLTAALSSALRTFDRWWANAMHDPTISRYGHDDSGSTAALALVAPAPAAAGGGWRLAVANLGDSRAILVHENRTVQQLCEVHNTGNQSELERLVEAGAQVVHPQAAAAAGAAAADGHARFFTKGPIWGKRGLKVSRALGDIQFKRPVALVTTDPFCTELHLAPCADHRLLLLMSDGVTDVLSDGQIADLALAAVTRPGRRPGDRSDESAKAVAEAVVSAAAHHERAQDNMTCVCVVFGADADAPDGAC